MRATNTERAAEHRRELRELRDLLSESQSCVIALREQLQANAGVWPSREELIRELAEYRERVGAMEREGTSLPPSRAPSPPTAPPPDIDAAELVPLRTEIGELQRVKNRQSSVIDMLRQEVHDLREGRTSKQVAWQNRRSMKVGENPVVVFSSVQRHWRAVRFARTTLPCWTCACSDAALPEKTIACVLTPRPPLVCRWTS
jgi:hypothetical protein